MSAPRNIAAPNTPYFTPAQAVPVGTALDANPPTLFKPLQIRSATFQNRIWVAPMCMYSASNGALTDFHFAHITAMAFRGPSLTIIEATAVQPRGRISPEDAGLWSDEQIPPIRRIATFLHSQGQKLGIQLAHAGRKASTVAPWLVATRGASVLATADVGGWPNDVQGASALRWGQGYAMPKEMTLADIRAVVADFASAAKRAVQAGVDVIEIHAAHGYLLCSFLSPISNRRTDMYGGSFENRTRIVVEVIEAVRAAIPDSMPLLLRVSATEWMEGYELGSWDLPQTIRLAKMLPALGVDLLDCSSGGNCEAQKISIFNSFQIGLAGQIRRALHREGITDLLIGAVGMITEAEAAKSILEDGEKTAVEVEDELGHIAQADVVLAARVFLREPEWVLRVAHKLGVKVHWPNQNGRGIFPKESKI